MHASRTVPNDLKSLPFRLASFMPSHPELGLWLYGFGVEVLDVSVQLYHIPLPGCLGDRDIDLRAIRGKSNKTC